VFLASSQLAQLIEMVLDSAMTLLVQALALNLLDQEFDLPRLIQH
jgi:hypothetical protein